LYVRIGWAHLIAASAGVMAVLSSLAHAADSLQTIDVIADSATSTGEVEHSEYTGYHQQITREQLQRRYASLADVLAFETGVQNRQIGGFGTFSSVTMRAASSAQTGVYLDGILLNGGGSSAIDLATIELLNVESVDIYRGSTPLQLGQSTIGGAVNLSTLSAQKAKPQTRLLFGGGSFATGRLQLSHQSKQDRWDIVSAISRQQSDNDFKFIDNNGTPLNPNDDQLERRHNAGAVRQSVLLKAGYQWSQRARTDLIFQLSDRDLGVPEWRNAETNVASFDTDSGQFQLSHSVDSVSKWNTRHTLFQHSRADHFDDRLSQVGLGSQNANSISRTSGFKSYWEHIGDKGTFGITTELRSESLDADDSLDVGNNYEASRSVLSATTQYAWFTRQDRLLITPSLRLQSIDDKHTGGRTPRGSRNVAVFSPQLGAHFEATDRLTLRTNVGHFYREPTFYELFGTQGLIEGNLNLKPERGFNADAGISFAATSRWQIDASVFASWRDELISTSYDSRGIGRHINTGRARVLGMEFGNELSISPAISARINVTLQDARSIENTSSINGKQLPGEARTAAYAHLQYRRSNFLTWLEIDANRDRYYDQGNLLPARNHWLQNIGVGWNRRNWQANFAINNLGNHVVEDFNGFPRPGRAFQFALTLTL